MNAPKPYENPHPGMQHTLKNMKPETVRTVKTVLLILAAVLSVTVIGAFTSSASRQARIIRSLDEKKETVLDLAAGATATSITITLLPGDAATPIAEQLAELTNYFLLILCAIYLEKYLVTITGFLAFRILIPVAMILFVYCLYRNNPNVKRFAWKLTVFALTLYLVIPCSVFITSMIDRTYETSIQATLDAAKDASDEIAGLEESEEATLEEEEDEPAGFLESIQSLPGSIKDKAQEVVSGVTGFTAEMTEQLKSVLHRFIEAIAVMIITSCVIPILVFVVFFVLARSVLNSVAIRTQRF